MSDDIRPVVLGALLVAGLGAVTWVALDPRPIVDAPEEREVEVVMAPVVDTAVTVPLERDLASANDRVAALTDDLETTRTALAEARRALARSREQGSDLHERVATLQASVERREADLDQAARARDELLQALVDAVTAQEGAQAAVATLSFEVTGWRTEALAQRWHAFVAEATLTVCDRGTAHRQDRCRDAVADALGDAVQTAFRACVQGGQEQPEVVLASASAPLPAGAWRLPHDRSFGRKGWVVQACDPTLPEADG